jgi:adenine-specific DNA methylase
MNQAPMTMQIHNPDVLSCIANLSNDEVFTPPQFVNQMLDTLEESWARSNNGEIIWTNKEITFLDPCTKSGVFLREIVNRLNKGLVLEIVDLTARIDHILTKQVFGIGLTELTGLLARRSVYCSKSANGIHSVARTFDSKEGNIWFERTDHEWQGANCRFCGAGKLEYKRSGDLETHAYAFIHTTNIQERIGELFGGQMHFDVIIGNPPYQLSDGGFGVSARPIYHLFVDQAKKLDPRFLCMVVPARWFAGGKGLDEFRKSMLEDTRIRVLHDFIDSTDIFPGTQIKGGVCYFLWDRDNQGIAQISTHDKGQIVSSQSRPLLEPGNDIFIRYEVGLNILRKVIAVENKKDLSANHLALNPASKFSESVSARKPFGIATDYRGKSKASKGDLKIFQIGGSAFISPDQLKSGESLVKKWKVFIAYAGSGDQYPNPVIGKPIIGAPGTVCTETYLAIGPFENAAQANNVATYISTRFLRFLVLLRKSSQHVTRTVYDFVPAQDFSKEWTDEKLYDKYGINTAEIAFIESMIKPMELGNE